MGKALFSASKTLGDPSALWPQGDKKKGPQGDKKKGPQGDKKRGLRVTCGGHPERSEGSQRER